MARPKYYLIEGLQKLMIHHSNDIISLLQNIKGKYKYLLIGNNKTLENTDEMNMYHFNQRNLLIEPFNINLNHIIDKIYESENDRDLLLIKSEDS